ncbi:unnamed protein product [Linum tenue]|nr:unnamed protein product [Linum tenue]
MAPCLSKAKNGQQATMGNLFKSNSVSNAPVPPKKTTTSSSSIQGQPMKPCLSKTKNGQQATMGNVLKPNSVSNAPQPPKHTMTSSSSIQGQPMTPCLSKAKNGQQVTVGNVVKPSSISNAPQPPKQTTSSPSLVQARLKGTCGTFHNSGNPTSRHQRLLQSCINMQEEVVVASEEQPSMGPTSTMPTSSSAPSHAEASNTNISEPSEEAFEEQIHQGTNASDEVTQKKQGRGPTRGVSLHKRTEKAGKKPEVQIDAFLGRPLIRKQSNDLASSLGLIAHLYYWPIEKKDKANLLEEVILKLQLKLDMGNIRDNPVEMEKLWGHFLKSVRERRSRTKADYYTVNKQMARQNKPSYLSADIWKNLCDHWDSEKVQEIAVTNAENRTHVQNLNTQGSAAYVCMFQEKKAQQESGELSKMEFFKWQDTKGTEEWRNPNKKEQYEKMLELVETTRDSENPISPDEAFHKILGYSSGYCHGLGYGQAPPSRKRDRVEVDYAQLFEDKKQLQDRCANLEDLVSQLNEKQADSDQQLAITKEKLASTGEQLEEFRSVIAILKGKGIV